MTALKGSRALVTFSEAPSTMATMGKKKSTSSTAARMARAGQPRFAARTARTRGSPRSSAVTSSFTCVSPLSRARP